MSDTVKRIQNKLGVPQTGTLNADTAKAIMWFYQLSPEEAAHFLGQFHHETQGFRSFVENMNYTSAERIIAIFRRYFPGGISEAQNFVRSPEKLANRVYANRMGNGNEESGDGFRFRGRGMVHLTGRDNYTAFARWMHNPEILQNPNLVADEYALDAGYYFFEVNKLFSEAKKVDDSAILRVSRGINIGNANSKINPHGLEDRINQTKRIYEWVKK
jgi:putative chitinase